jgi:hypothetical protein
MRKRSVDFSVSQLTELTHRVLEGHCLTGSYSVPAGCLANCQPDHTMCLKLLHSIEKEYPEIMKKTLKRYYK